MHHANHLISVSVVDDHEGYRETMRRSLLDAPGIVFVAAYPTAAAAFTGLQTHPVDVLIVDIQMPGMTGIQLLNKLGETDVQTQFLVCSSHSDNDLVFDALKAGASGYLLKDSSLDEVIAGIHELFNGGAPMTSFIARKVVSTFQRKVVRKFSKLSPRENEVLQLLSEGLQYKEIADELGISLQTVKIHIRNVYSKLHCQNKVEAISKYKYL